MSDTELKPVKELSILDQIMAYSVGPITDKSISMILVKEGIVKVRRTPVGIFARLVKGGKDITPREMLSFIHLQGEGFVDTIEKVIQGKGEETTLRSANEFPVYDLRVPKIPQELMHQVINFFRAVYAQQQTEAACFIRWNGREHYIEIPEQDLSGGGVKYTAGKNLDPIVMDIHSHHTMSSFFSTTDDGDEKGTQFFAVVGNIGSSMASVNIRARMDGEDLAYVHPGVVFEGIPMDFPAAWMENIKAPIPHLPTREERAMSTSRSQHELWDEDFAEANGKKRTIPHGEMEDMRKIISHGETVGDVLNDPLVLSISEDICTSVERDIFDSPEIFGSRHAIEQLRDMLTDRLNTITEEEVQRSAFLKGGYRG